MSKVPRWQRPERKEYMRQYYAERRDKLNERIKARSRDLKIAAINHYGGECACCGESEVYFLAIDHINGDGAQHRKEIGSGTRFARWLFNNGYPEGFRVLCHNCNFSIYWNGGVCAHKRVGRG